MPRLSYSRYLTDRFDLLADWRAKLSILGCLTSLDQHLLHAYFAFTKQLNEKEALTHRKTATTADPSLPQRAGKAMKRLRIAQSIEWAPIRPISIRRGSSRLLSVRAVLRPEPDLDAIAGTVLSLAIDLARREEADAA